MTVRKQIEPLPLPKPEILRTSKIIINFGIFAIIMGIAWPMLEPSLDKLPDPSFHTLLIMLAVCLLTLGVCTGRWWQAYKTTKNNKKIDLNKPLSSDERLGSIKPLAMIMIIGAPALILNLVEESFQWPLIFIYVGLLNFFGKSISSFTSKFHYSSQYSPYLGWFYIIGAILNIYLIQFHIENLQTYAWSYVGLGLVIQGLLMRKHYLKAAH